MLLPKKSVFVFIYTFVVMALFCIPSYFALNSTVNEEKYKATQEAIEWIEKNEENIFKETRLDVKNSVRFKIDIYNDIHQKVYASTDVLFKDLNFKIRVIYPYLYYQKEIKKEDGNLFYLVVQVKLNYAKIIFITTVLFFIVLLLVFLMSNLFVNSSIYPYRKMQKYMNDFFNDTMHELKTPLGVININLELLSKTLPASKHIQRIKAATKQMQMSYEDVEYYIKYNKVEYHKEVVNLSSYLNSRVLFFEDIALPKSIELHAQIEEDLIIYMNKVELQRIIDNTISNAIKYSSFKGKVFITLHKKDEDACALVIQDEGAGIKDIYKVLERFEREDAVQGGFGIGLNIVQKICNKNDVDLAIKSAHKEGSTFIYTFKLDKKKLLDRIDKAKGSV